MSADPPCFAPVHLGQVDLVKSFWGNVELAKSIWGNNGGARRIAGGQLWRPIEKPSDMAWVRSPDAQTFRLKLAGSASTESFQGNSIGPKALSLDGRGPHSEPLQGRKSNTG